MVTKYKIHISGSIILGKIKYIIFFNENFFLMQEEIIPYGGQIFLLDALLYIPVLNQKC